jgi:hypothetical protein
MNTFKRVTVSAGLLAALAGTSLPSQAIIQSVPGEAYLVPFVLYDSQLGINTLIQVKTPGSVGFDTIPRFFTAPNTTPTNANVSPVRDPDLGAIGGYTSGLKIYVFDSKSKEVLDTDIPTSPDALTLINYGDLVQRKLQALDGTKAYMIITNNKELFDGGAGADWRSAARFSMIADAFMVWDTGLGPVDAFIPTFAMSDGDDEVLGSSVSRANNVVHSSDGSIVDASPLTTGMRTSRDNGVAGEYMLFDLVMSNRFAPTLHVVWMDQNIGQDLQGLVFNDRERSCSQSLPIPNELNVIWSSLPALQPGAGNGLVPPIPWVDVATDLCYPESIVEIPADPDSLIDLIAGSDIFFPGYARFRVDEYAVNATPTFNTTSSGAAFSIHLQVDLLTADRTEFVFVPAFLPVETHLANQRGFFK